jgi:hypothetical protein
MIIGSIPGELRTYRDRSAAPASRSDREVSAPSRAVVAIPPIERAGPAPLNRPDASFVAHLIATAAGSPQTRSLRRATSDHARAAYGATVLRNAAPDSPGKPTLSRTA